MYIRRCGKCKWSDVPPEDFNPEAIDSYVCPECHVTSLDVITNDNGFTEHSLWLSKGRVIFSSHPIDER